MTDGELSEEDIRYQLVSLGDRLATGEIVDPGYAGAIGYLWTHSVKDTPDPGHLAIALRLLQLHVDAQPADDELAGAVRTALAICHSLKAETSEDLADWSMAVKWASSAVLSPYTAHEDYEDAVAELADLHVSRLMFLGASDIEVNWTAEVDSAIAELEPLLDTLHDPLAHALVSTQFARLLAGRGETVDVIDLTRSVEIMATALSTIPVDYPQLDEIVVLFGRNCHDLFKETEKVSVLDTAIAVLGPMIETREDPEIWDHYGDLLWQRGVENESPEDMREGLRWLRRFVAAHDDSPEYLRPTWGMLAEGYRALWNWTEDLSYADQAIECATEALRFSWPDDQHPLQLHEIRLGAVFPSDEARPDLAALLADKPVREWLDEALHLADTSEHRSIDLAVLAITVARGRIHLEAVDETKLMTRAAQGHAFEPVNRMLAVAGQVPDLPDEAVNALRVLVATFANMERTIAGDGDVDLSEFRAMNGMPTFWPEADGMSALLMGIAGVRTGSLAALDRAIELLGSGQLSGLDLDDGQAFAGVLTIFRLMLTGGGLAEIHRVATQARERLARTPATNTALTGWLDMIARIGEIGLSPDKVPHALGKPPTDVITRPMHLAARVIAAKIAGDVDALREVTRELTEMGPSLGADVRIAYDLAGAFGAIANSLVSEMDPQDRVSTQAAIDGLLPRWHALTTERSPMIDGWMASLATLLRRRGDPGDLEQSRVVGLDVLRSIGWQVMLQSSTEGALEIARYTVDLVDEVMAWCVQDKATDDLVRVLDGRRSLVLKAAITSRSVPDRLARLGRHDLARAWASDEPTEDFGELRRMVLRALDDADPLSTAPDVTEIQETLRRHGSDALVYLVPGVNAMAVVVSVKEVQVRPLDLDLGVVNEYRAAYEAWHDAPPGKGREYEAWSQALADVCDWAWPAAGEILRAAGTRVVVVPVGLLGLVPWHAARKENRYLIEDVCITTVPSARLFCELVNRPDIDGRAVFVGNPGRDLLAGATEAAAVHSTFYPDGVLMGVTNLPPRSAVPFPDGTGTPAQLLSHLREPVSMLHLACHAQADIRDPLASEVRLSGEPLSAKELLENTVDVDVVTLAACATNMTGVDYDEALTLSSTFLAAGARSVVGSLWPVPAGRETVQLMFMFHRYLRTEAMSPADSLRMAQLWMLDPDRRYPDEMPDYVRNLAGGGAPDVRRWAGFMLVGR